jgi:hypothetical protein
MTEITFTTQDVKDYVGRMPKELREEIKKVGLKIVNYMDYGDYNTAYYNLTAAFLRANKSFEEIIPYIFDSPKERQGLLFTLLGLV